jgi:hypothetical protein
VRERHDQPTEAAEAEMNAPTHTRDQGRARRAKTVDVRSPARAKIPPCVGTVDSIVGLRRSFKLDEDLEMEDGTRWYRRLAGMLAARLPDARLDDVADPRARRGRRWKKLDVLLGAVVVGLCAGAKSLAQLEKMTAEIGLAMRRSLGIVRRIPDTTMRDLLCRIEPRDLRGALHSQVRAAHRRKALQPERLPFGVLVLDGKSTAIAGCDDHYAQRQSQGDGFTSLLRTVTCTLVSAAAKPCIDAIPIPASTNEMGHFATALRAVVRAYASLALFRLVSYDAGACSLENASVVRGLNLHYLFGLKGTQPTLLGEAKRLLGARPSSAADAVSEDVVGANVVTRRAYITEEMAAFGDWDHLRTVLRIESETRSRDGKLVAHDNRYFLSSLPSDALDDAQWLRVVRLHWGVENNCHNTFDTVFVEDDKPWIQDCPQGALAVLLLRRIAYNLLALFRSVTQRSDERRQIPWADLLRGVHNMLVATTAAQLAHLRPRVSAAALA